MTLSSTSTSPLLLLVLPPLLMIPGVLLLSTNPRLGAAEVARRLEFVFPAVLRASFVLFSVTYSYAVVAFAMYCATPLGTQPIDSVADHSMMQR